MCGRVNEATAYVLGTLSQHQRERYGRHARDCAACADELDLLNAAACAPELMASRPVRPPSDHEYTFDGGRSRVSGTETGHSGQKRSQSRPDPFGKSSGKAQRKRRRAGLTMPKPALTAILGLLVVAMLTVYMSNRTVSTTFAQGKTAWPTTAGIALQLQGNHGELLLDHLPAAPASDHYEVWYLTTRSHALTKLSATLTLNKDGQAGMILPGDVHDYTAIGVYAVPNSGTRVPSLSDHPVAIVYVPTSGKNSKS